MNIAVCLFVAISAVDLDPIAKQLNSKKPEEQIAGLEAAKRLGEQAEPLAVKVCQLLLEGNPKISLIAADTLRKLAPKEAPHIIAIKAEKRAASATASIDKLTSSAVSHAAVRWLLVQLNDKAFNDPHAAIHCFQFLANTKDTSEEHLALAKLYISMDRVSPYAVDSVGAIARLNEKTRSENMKYLIGLLVHKRPTIRKQAAIQLGLLKKDGQPALSALKAAAFDTDKEVREAIETAIERIEKS